MSGQPRKATRWRRNRKFGDAYGGRAKVKLAENVFARCHSLSPPSKFETKPILIEDNPSKGYFFPLTVSECWQSIQSLPDFEYSGLTHIWCRRPSSKKQQKEEQPFAEFVCGSGVRAIIIYPWPINMVMPLGTKKPNNSVLNEFKKFDAEVIRTAQNWVVKFSLHNLRKYYVDALILHEVGHHVDWYQRHWSKANSKKLNDFANQYAVQRTATSRVVFDHFEEKHSS
ncbi:hypothetical protein [Hirschia maritima]|uniref:hypothetical protein n=1 Tax=Hirschia maritima TaxID=1121961 RepID=UPI00037DD8B7|nr:hypothetical protein [Hirschia maritima]